ncbi:FadR/GntR family transcriptional regulator [Paenibacillus ginsengarvi]|uniref:FadR family transcriptional regulator n=1 Tax=Paenibacillus ginsengarvi TaxID=400777 RepID=A0A3B0ARE6_9BACL|nr:FadR/GntR family transcriptional regulator [Paenibacillus ginsengarvi]RKN62993.1 FadR family transcriptional regulator [Paenibacillus ginsengarvi]
MLNSLTRKPIAEDALEELKKLIQSGEVKVGDQIPPENQLVAMLGISRPTVREVLVALQAQGYIEIKRGKGAFVIDKEEFDRKRFLNWFQENEYHIRELLETRMAIEPMAASLAAQHISDEELQELERIQADMAGFVEKQSLESIVSADERFHETIFSASRNKLLQFIYSNLVPSLREYRGKAFSHPANPTLVIDAHMRIITALKTRDSTASFNEMLLHIQSSQHDVVSTANALFSIGKLSIEKK